MAQRPTTTELLRYLEGELSGARADRLRTLAAHDTAVAEEIEQLRRDLQLAESLREASVGEDLTNIDRKLEITFTASVLNSSLK